MQPATESLQWVEVASSDAVPEGEARTFEIGDIRIALARVEGTVYAVQDVCTHDDGPLGQGQLCGFSIQCPRHGARFDVRSGEVMSMPAIVPIGTFQARERDGKILVALEPAAEPAGQRDEDW